MNHIIPTNTKFAFTTRRVNHSDIANIEADFTKAASGDLVLAQVHRIGSHKRIQLASGRNSELHVGDPVVLCCGARYAPDQFEGIAVVENEQCDMLAAGGVIGQMREKHGVMKHPTQLRPIGLLTDNCSQVINIQRYALPFQHYSKKMPVIAVTGAAMNSGKTTAAFSLVNGLAKSGLAVAAIKITGTGAFGDFNAFLDAGAFSVTDFTDAGMVTTYKQPTQRILKGAESLLANAQALGADVAVVELGDGVLQEETANILSTPLFNSWLQGVMFAAPDALSALAGTDYLAKMRLPLIAISGLLTRSPLLCKEFAKFSETRVLDKNELADKETALALLHNQQTLRNVA